MGRLEEIIARRFLGWASAPYDPLWERRHPRRAAWMALAGPAARTSPASDLTEQ